MLHYNKNIGIPWNAHHNKNIPPLVGAAMINAGASILGGITGLFGGSSAASKSLQAQREANATNLQIARETNEANRNLWREQSEYNTPANQMARFRAAGINPYMAVSRITGGNAETAPVMQSAVVDPTYNSTAAAAELQGYSKLADSIPAAVNFALDAQAKVSQNKILASQAKYSEAMTYQQLLEQMERFHLLNKMNKKAAIENFYLPSLSDMNLQTAEQHIKESNERIYTMQAQRDVMEVSKRYNIALTDQVRQNISNSVLQLAWNIKVARSQIASNYASSEKALAEADVARQTKKAVAQQVELFKAETKKTLYEANIIPHGKKADSYVNALVNQVWFNATETKYRGYNQMHQHQDWTNFYNGDENAGSFGYRFGHTVQNWSPFVSFLK